jgi:hypothetical protein
MEVKDIREQIHACGVCGEMFTLRIGQGWIQEEHEIKEATVYIDAPHCKKCGNEKIHIGYLAPAIPEPKSEKDEEEE